MLTEADIILAHHTRRLYVQALVAGPSRPTPRRAAHNPPSNKVPTSSRSRLPDNVVASTSEPLPPRRGRSKVTGQPERRNLLPASESHIMSQTRRQVLTSQLALRPGSKLNRVVEHLQYPRVLRKRPRPPDRRGIPGVRGECGYRWNKGDSKNTRRGATRLRRAGTSRLSAYHHGVPSQWLSLP